MADDRAGDWRRGRRGGEEGVVERIGTEARDGAGRGPELFGESPSMA